MTQFLTDPEQQHRTMAQLYAMMSAQVKSFHRSRHRGSSTSISADLAQELLESMVYTMDQAGGLFAHADAAQALHLGREILASRLQEARDKLALVRATAPHRQTECRWEALVYLDRYLSQYDHLHLAHRGPDDLFYPILIAPPEGLRGIDSCIFYLNILWIENQIMAAISEAALDAFVDRLPAATLNPTEQLLLNGIAKSLLGSAPDPLLLDPEEHLRLLPLLHRTDEQHLLHAAGDLCARLGLRDEAAIGYVRAIVPLLTFHLKNHPCPYGLFL